MKNIYLLLFLLPVLFSGGCSKDILKPYEDRIVGEWRLAGANSLGIGGNPNNLPFTAGNILFKEDGSLMYTNPDGDVFQGSWYIRKGRVDDKRIQSLTISAANFNNEIVLAESYDDINFRSRDHFVGKIKSTLYTLTSHFRRI